MSEIVNMSNKLRALVDEMGSKASFGDRVVFEMILTFAYTEGFKDGYAKGYTEALFEPKEDEGDKQ